MGIQLRGSLVKGFWEEALLTVADLQRLSYIIILSFFYMNKWLYYEIIIVIKIRDSSRRGQMLQGSVKGETSVGRKILRNMGM